MADAALSEHIRSAMARCEALEDEASDRLSSPGISQHEIGFLRGQKSTAKSLRRELAEALRQAEAQ